MTSVSTLHVLSMAWDWIYGISPTVWAAIIALLAASLTLLGTARIAAVQHQHETKRGENERLLALRKDVFLRGADGVSLATTTISRIADLSVPDSDLVLAASEVSAILARVQVIGNQETIEAILALALSFTSAFLDLYLERLMTRAKIAEIDGDDAEKMRAVAELQIPLAKKARERGFEIIPHVTAALFAAREELGISTDRQKFLKIQAVGLAKQAETVKRFWDAIEGLRTGHN